MAKIAQVLKQNVVVENRPGAGGVVGTQHVVAAPPDGYTLLFGTQATTGSRVTVNYAGYLYSATAAENKGTRFDAGTLPFTVGTGVIAGFSQGVVGMRVGGLRRVIIPPSLGYGSQANGSIPANSTLVFDIELTTVQ